MVGSPLAACKGWGTGLSPFLPRPALLTSPLTRKRNGENSCHRRLAVQCRYREQVEGTSRQRGQKQELRRNALQLYRSRFAAALTAELVHALINVFLL